MPTNSTHRRHFQVDLMNGRVPGVASILLSEIMS